MLTWNTRPKIKTGKQNIQQNIAEREEAGHSVDIMYHYSILFDHELTYCHL